MPLYEVGNGQEKEILAADLEHSLIANYTVGRFDNRTYNKMCRTITEELKDLRPTAKTKLIWTKAGALIGHKSVCPHRDLTHIWDNAIAIYGEDKALLKFIGTLVMWRIALDDANTWLVYREDSGKVDEDTGKIVKVCTYWIDNDYVFPNKKPTVEDLMSKFKRR